MFGCGDSNKQPKEKAERLTRQAEEAMSSRNYDDAERLITESIEIHSGKNDEAKLAETYSLLSSIQISAGKRSSALETLLDLRRIYQHGADRNAELRTLIEIGKIQFRLGNHDIAISTITEAYNNSKLFRLDPITAIASLELSKIYFSISQFEKALFYASLAKPYVKLPADNQQFLEILSLQLSSLNAQGKTDEAFTLFREGEDIILSNSNFNGIPFLITSGKAFLSAEEWVFAKDIFEKVLSTADQQNKALYKNERISAYIGIAEIYFKNFSFVQAQHHYSQAYTIAKEISDDIAQAYIVIRVADCIAKRAASNTSLDGFIRAAQLYEQAQTLFTRAGFGVGEAIVLHRLATIKELSQDDNAAITFYKRAFEKYLDNTVPLHYFSLSVDFNDLFTSASNSFSYEEWFSENLVELLLKYKRYREALMYVEHSKALHIQSQLNELNLQFRDPAKKKRYSDLQNSNNQFKQHVLELQHILSTQKIKDKNYINKLQQQLTFAKSKLQSDAISLAQEFPEFSFVTISAKTPIERIIESVNTSNTVLNYYFTKNAAWVFVVRNGEDVLAVKLSSFGYELQKKMQKFMMELHSNKSQSSEYLRLSQELYSFLIKPIESYGKQKFIIIPSQRYAKFPFHALLNNGKSLIEMIEVAYLPHLSLLQSTAQLPKFINNVITFGFTPDTRWGLEFELRDIRSFFRNTQVFVNQTATVDKLENALGEILQISSQFQRSDNKNYSFTVSDGNAIRVGKSMPISFLSTLHPFQIVYLSDVQATENNISEIHPLLLLLNGSTAAVANQYPINSNISKTFGGNFYSSLSDEINPYRAYRRAVIQIRNKKEFSGENNTAAYFYYGTK